MKKIILLCLIFMSAAVRVQPQDSKSSFGVTFNGYVNLAVFYDTRETVSSREGHLLLYPAPRLMDPKGKDINAHSTFNMLAAQTRLAAKITAPDVLSAKTSGWIEGEFIGHSDPDINGFRLRHAYIKLNWESAELLMGQYWNPFFVVEASPGQMGSSAGAPFSGFARNPQLRFTYAPGSIQLMAAVLTQRDFASTGPNGNSSIYLRNSGMPEIQFQAQYKSSSALAGAGISYKNLVPRTASAKNYKTDNKAESLAFTAFAKASYGMLTAKAQTIYGSNITDLTAIGGYAVKSTDSVTAIEEYTPVYTHSVWAEVEYGKTVKGAVFAGYTKNLGANDNITGAIYSRGGNIDKIMRIAPRITWDINKIKFALECDYVAAYYGTPDAKASVKNTYKSENTRFLGSVFYYF